MYTPSMKLYGAVCFDIKKLLTIFSFTCYKQSFDDKLHFNLGIYVK